MSADGLFIAVVGPSGAGKDTLIAAATRAFADEPRFVFPRRLITRPVDHTEDAREISMTDWEDGVAGEAFALAWRAHETAYAIPAETIDAVAEGRVVVANVSRTVLGRAREVYGRAGALVVTATQETLARRLAARGREGAEARAARLARAVPDLPADLTTRSVANDGSLEEGAAAFIASLRALADDTHEPTVV